MRGREPRQLGRKWMMMKSQDFRDNKVVLGLHRVHLARARPSEGCPNKAEGHQDPTSPLQHDRKLKRWTQTIPPTLVMRLLRENLPHLRENLLQGNLHKANLHKANLHKANLLQAKVHKAGSHPNKANLPGKVHKTINKANLKGLIRNVSKLRLL